LTAISLRPPEAWPILAQASSRGSACISFPSRKAGIVAAILPTCLTKGAALAGRIFAFGAGERFLVTRVLVLDVLDRRRLQLLHLLGLLAHLQLDRHQRASLPA